MIDTLSSVLVAPALILWLPFMNWVATAPDADGAFDLYFYSLPLLSAAIYSAIAYGVLSIIAKRK